MIASRVDRRIRQVPCLHIAQLAAANLLPSLPNDVEAAMGMKRMPTLNEASMLSWLLYGDVEKPLGVAAYRGAYDFMTGSDAKEIVHIAGTQRAVVELMRHMVEHAQRKGLRVIGSVHLENRPMMALLSGLGYVRTRIVFEDR